MKEFINKHPFLFAFVVLPTVVYAGAGAAKALANAVIRPKPTEPEKKG